MNGFKDCNIYIKEKGIVNTSVSFTNGVITSFDTPINILEVLQILYILRRAIGTMTRCLMLIGSICQTLVITRI